MAFQEPMSDQPKVHGTNPMFSRLLHHCIVDRDRRHLRETVLVDLKAGPVPGVRLSWHVSRAAFAPVSTSGQCASMASIMVRAGKQNMPEFQKNRPLAT